jgi:hypothetical protein
MNNPASQSTQTSQNKPFSSFTAGVSQIVVTEKRRLAFDQNMQTKIIEFENLSDLVLNRQLRTLLNQVCQSLKDIRTNCQNDPLDINEEAHLPVVMQELIGSLKSYTDIIPHRTPSNHLVEQQALLFSIFSEAQEWLKQVFDRMLTNDHQGLEVRARVLSSVFERGRELHKVETAVREAIKEDKNKINGE